MLCKILTLMRNSFRDENKASESHSITTFSKRFMLVSGQETVSPVMENTTMTMGHISKATYRMGMRNAKTDSSYFQMRTTTKEASSILKLMVMVLFT